MFVAPMQPSRRVPDEPELEAALDAWVEAALAEDVGTGDRTTEVAAAGGRRAVGRLVAKEAGVAAGLALFGRVFEHLEPSVRVAYAHRDGDAIAPGDELVRVEGSAAALLVGERTALNVVGRLCGIATMTRRYVDAAAGGARVLDTRKTTPGLRRLEKYAVRCGGGENHRFGLFDEAMIKDNHLDAGGWSMRALLAALRERHGAGLRITAEARDEAEALDAVAGDADVVMLDNLSPAEMRRLVPLLLRAAEGRARPLEIEASGGVTLETIGEIAATGVHRVSVGALTHSAPSLDLSFAMEMGGE